MESVEEADELYAVPPEEFVSARTALAKRLREEEGRRDDAAEVAGLRKPPLALWAVNELARRRGGVVEALLGAADRLRRGEDADEELRRAHAELVRAAGELLEETGHAASDATLQRVARTLHGAAAAGGDDAAALRRGALREELEPGGFEAMAAFGGAAPKAKERPRGGRREPRDEEARRRARVEQAEAALEEARSRERELRREAEQAERAADRVRRDADSAAAEVEKAERALARARNA